MYLATTMVCFCVGIAIFDLKTLRIPDIFLITFAVVMIIMEGSQTYTQLALRLAAAAGTFLLFGAVWYFTQGIGFGDVKYAALLGYLLGHSKIVPAFLFTALLSVIVYSIGVLFFAWSKTKKIPYAPFLSAGAVVSLIIDVNFIGGVT